MQAVLASKVHVAVISTSPSFAPCSGLRIKENKEVYEGEVTELTPEFTESQVRGNQQTHR